MRLLRYARNDVIARSRAEQDDEAIPFSLLLYAVNLLNLCTKELDYLPLPLSTPV